MLDLVACNDLSSLSYAQPVFEQQLDVYQHSTSPLLSS